MDISWRRRTLAAAALVLVCGCGAGDGASVDAAPAATDSCGPVDFPPLQFGSHLLGDTRPPIPYSSTPPTSGWHLSGAVPEGMFDEPLPETAQVSVLEAGGVVVTYRDLSPTDLGVLRAAVAANHADRVVLTPYERLEPGSTAFTSWGALQVCEGVDLQALDAYAAAYASTITPHD